MLEFLELLGLATVTYSKKSPSWAHSSPMSRPRKILATNTPPGRNTNEVMVKAATMSCDWMYSSRSWSPVTAAAAACHRNHKKGN